jgi:hypothetical protein
MSNDAFAQPDSPDLPRTCPGPAALARRRSIGMCLVVALEIATEAVTD